MYVSRDDIHTPKSPKLIAEVCDASPSYMARITNALVKAGLAKSHRGAHGGITIAKSPKDISLLEIVEACQGKILPSYCRECNNPALICAFHEAMLELHLAIIDVLKKWTLAKLIAKPRPMQTIKKLNHDCLVWLPKK